MKLRGAAQGRGPLVAEVVVAELAESVGLSVPARSLVTVHADIASAERDDELVELLAASVGVNLGFNYLEGAHELAPGEIDAIPMETRAEILWLDRLVLNPDRTERNPNLLRWEASFWLIDHGASLRFQYDWAGVTEDLPRQPGSMPEAHIFEASVPNVVLRQTDERLAKMLTREVVERAVSSVPDDFLEVHDPTRQARRRAAYAAFLWKRLQPPRPFLDARELPPVGGRGKKPDWLRHPA